MGWIGAGVAGAGAVRSGVAGRAVGRKGGRVVVSRRPSIARRAACSMLVIICAKAASWVAASAGGRVAMGRDSVGRALVWLSTA